MILYKYVPFDVAAKILDNNSIGFSLSSSFNDPFDVPWYPDEPLPVSDSSLLSVEKIFSRIHTMAKCSTWAERTGILSLTRTPTNPLMWAHYAHNHQGVVIGVDTVEAGLTDEGSNLIPAQYGSIIYVSGRSQSPFVTQPQTGIEVGNTHHFPSDHYEKLQRVFLHKPLCWAYEEEVRVVKCISGISSSAGTTQSGTFHVIDVHGKPMYLYALPPNSVKEIYFGIRSEDETSDDLHSRATAAHPGVAAYQCYLRPGNLQSDTTSTALPLSQWAIWHERSLFGRALNT